MGNSERVVATGTIRGGADVLAVLAVAAPEWLECEPVVCRRTPDSIFFPETYNHVHEAEVWEARVICGACPVRADCLEWALARPGLEGIWGGTTPLERRRIRKARKEVAA